MLQPGSEVPLQGGDSIEDATIEVLDEFLAEPKCDALVELAASRDFGFSRSRTANGYESGRTSQSCFFPRRLPGLVAEIEERAAAVVGLPVSHVERLQELAAQTRP